MLLDSENGGVSLNFASSASADAVEMVVVHLFKLGDTGMKNKQMDFERGTFRSWHWL